jgi:uncharacterized delta-60 repeat protein
MFTYLRTLSQSFDRSPRPFAKARRRPSPLRREVEPAEVRLLLSSFALTATADGTVADRNLDGVFEDVSSAGTSVQNRWFDFLNIGEERGVFEFDLSQFAPGSHVLSARLGLYFTSFTSDATSGPTVQFAASAGDGVISGADGNVSAVPAGNISVSSLGYQEFYLTTSAIQSFVGGKVSVRMANSALNAHWVSAASLEDTFRAEPTLIVDIAPPVINLSVDPSTVREDGSQVVVGTVTRNGNMSEPLVVALSSNDTTEASVPSTVTIPAGQSAAQFFVSVVDDQLLDGSQNVQISASGSYTDGTPFGADVSFGLNGIAQTNLATNIQFPHAGLSVQVDGKILVASEAGGGGWRLSRYLANGSPDTTFGTGGTTTTALAAAYPVPYRIVVQPDGKILVGGKYSSGFGSAVLVRYNQNGTIDTNFGNSGIADLANVGAWIEDIAIRPDGSILLACAFSGTSYFRVVGLNSRGVYDSQFGVKTYSTINDMARAIELLPDGRFIVAGRRTVARFTPNGAIDTTFGTNGKTTLSFTSPAGGEIVDAVVDGGGRITLGISTYTIVNGSSTNHDFATKRLTAQGGQDFDYANGGIRSVDFAGLNDLPTSMVMQSDNKLLMGGFTETASGARDLALVRFDMYGNPDPSLDSDGKYQKHLVNYSGELILGVAQSPLDGKLLALGGWADDYRLLQFHSGAGSFAMQASAELTVTDNENAPPVINPQSFSIPENVPTGYELGAVLANDPDPGQYVTWEITSTSLPGAFSLHPFNGQLTVADSTLLDHETAGTVTLSVTVRDSGTPAQSTTGTVTISIADVNESPVMADQTFEFDENPAKGSVVGTMVASDPDLGQQLTWSFGPGAGDLSRAFSLNASNGRLTVVDRSLLNFEVVPAFALPIVVTDNASPALSAYASAIVFLRDVNEAPVIVPLGYQVDENTATGTVIGAVLASDEDSGGANVTYALTGSSVPGAFSVDSATGEIRVASSGLLNFEQSSAITLNVTVTEIGTSLSGMGTLTVALRDLNEVPVIANQSFSTAENSPNSTVIGTVIASDPDSGQGLSYSLTASSFPGALSLNSSTGHITVANSSLLNYEAASVISLSVSVADNGNPSLVSTATVTVSLTNVNEAPVMSDATFSVREYLNSGLIAGTMAVSDPDAGQSLRFAIVDSSVPEAFMIHLTTGEILVWNPQFLDYETVTSITLTVSVTDSGSPQLSDTATVVISINDINESPVMGSQTFSIAEMAANGTEVGMVVGSDVDQGQSLTWEIFSSPVPGAFAIDSSTGRLTVANSSLLDFESRSSIELGVRLSDNGSPVLATVAPITIQLTDVNEAPSMTGATYSLAEHSAVGTVVGTVTGADPDAGQSLSYAIVGGNPNGAFAINAVTGQITVANSASVDYETTPIINLTVQVTDNGVPAKSASAAVVIQLLDRAESVTVGLDVTPGDSSSTIRRNAKFEVAVLSTATFDARLVVVSSIRFGIQGTEDSVVRGKKNSLTYSYRDVNGDGRLDLVLMINAADAGLSIGDNLVTLTGELEDGRSLFGTSTINVKR